MLKKIVAYILAVVSLGFCPVDKEINYVTPETVLLQLYEVSQCEIEYFNTNSYLIYEKEFITIDMQGKICDDIAEKLNLIDIQIEKDQRSTYNSLVMKGTNKYGDNITVIVQSSKKEDFKETIITLDCTNYKIDNYININNKIRSVMDALGDVSYNTVIVGYRDIDKADTMLKKKYVKGLFDSVGAKVVENFSDDKIVSITGYDEDIESHLKYFNKKVNINIAVRRDDYNKKAYLYIASPLINIEY